MYADNFSSAAFSALTERAETNSVEMQIVVIFARGGARTADEASHDINAARTSAQSCFNKFSSISLINYV